MSVPGIVYVSITKISTKDRKQCQYLLCCKYRSTINSPRIKEQFWMKQSSCSSSVYFTVKVAVSGAREGTRNFRILTAGTVVKFCPV